jgi:hypothetical protein
LYVHNLFKEIEDEKDFSAKQQEESAEAWIPSSDGDTGWPCSTESQTSKRKAQTVGISKA